MDRDEREASLARVPMIVISVLLVVAVILGVATGSISQKTFQPPPPSPADPITIP